MNNVFTKTKKNPNHMQHAKITPNSASLRRLFLISLENTLVAIRKYALLMILLVTASSILSGQKNSMWLTAGQNLHNTRNAGQEDLISPSSIMPEGGKGLEVKWVFETGGDVSATPSTDGQNVYFPDWDGNLYKVNATTGLVAWQRKIGDYTGIPGDFARATPAIAGRSIIIGTQARADDSTTLDGAHILAINKTTGELRWITKVDDFPGAVITQSAVVHGNRVYVGVSSNEEALANNDEYPCCSFRGSMLCLNANTGQIIWKTYMVPDLPGFSGNAVWGSTPVIDTKRKSVYIATGNNYTVPQEILDCVAAGGTSEQVRNCILAVEGSKENYFDAIVALDLKTGAVKWSNSVLPFDAWTVACLFEGENCPDEAGPDYDFGQGPALFTAGRGANRRELLGAGQKSGIYWAFDPDNGEVVWSTEVGPGGTLGGLQWGSAVDGDRVYVAVSNNRYTSHLMTTGPGRGRTVNGGFWAALDARTGELLWENAGINPPRSAPDSIINPIATNQGPVSVANGVVFAGAMDTVGTMYGFDAETGEVLWSFESGGSVISGAAIAQGSVYWGSGYGRLGGSPNNQLYAFTVDESEPLVEELQVVPPALTGFNADETVQNHPNPFTESTELSFTLPEADHVTIRIYNVMGNEIETLAQEVWEKGSHQITWSPASSLPEGTYTVQFITSAGSVSKQLIKIQSR
jgi:polyvinyl alcohol dehydrogenase (cytochrome)